MESNKKGSISPEIRLVYCFYQFENANRSCKHIDSILLLIKELNFKMCSVILCYDNTFGACWNILIFLGEFITSNSFMGNPSFLAG